MSDEKISRTRWLEFKNVTLEGAKTRTIEVWNLRETLLGHIKWFGRWRQYAFFPAVETVWNRECLRDVQDVINELVDARKQKA